MGKIKKAVTAVVAAAAGTAGAVYAAYRYVFYFNDKRTEKERLVVAGGDQYQREKEKLELLMQEMAALPYEEVFVTSYDGKRLHGRYYHLQDGAPLQIQIHGYRSDGVRDFCGGSKGARQMGMNVLLVDQRAHGKSEGHTITFGICERHDCVTWATYALERFGKDTPVFLTGLSMGAASVLMAADLDLPENVAGIIADCPYSSPKGIICKVGKDMKLPIQLVWPFVKLGAKIFGDFDPEASSALQAVKNAKVPILLIHGEDDRFVPCEMSREIYQAGQDCSGEKGAKITIETFPDAGHGLSYILDGERYDQIVKKFVDQCLVCRKSQ